MRKIVNYKNPINKTKKLEGLVSFKQISKFEKWFKISSIDVILWILMSIIKSHLVRQKFWRLKASKDVLKTFLKKKCKFLLPFVLIRLAAFNEENDH